MKRFILDLGYSSFYTEQLGQIDTGVEALDVEVHGDNLLLNIDRNEFKEYDEIESIDEAAEKLGNAMHGLGFQKYNVSPETEFWGHCSNIQAWYENKYDTRLLHRNIAFPLLEALIKTGELLAKKVLKEEIAQRLESGYPSVVLYLIKQNYLKYLS